jgi:hypothetical protein
MNMHRDSHLRSLFATLAFAIRGWPQPIQRAALVGALRSAALASLGAFERAIILDALSDESREPSAPAAPPGALFVDRPARQVAR